MFIHNYYLNKNVDLKYINSKKIFSICISIYIKMDFVGNLERSFDLTLGRHDSIAYMISQDLYGRNVEIYDVANLIGARVAREIFL